MMFLRRRFFNDVFYIDIFTPIFYHRCFAFEDRFDVCRGFQFQRSTLSSIDHVPPKGGSKSGRGLRTRSLEPLDMMAMAMAMAMARVHAHLVDFVDEIDGVLREIAGADPGGGHGGPMPPPFGTEQALNAEVYRALSACSYSDTAHISV